MCHQKSLVIVSWNQPTTHHRGCFFGTLTYIVATNSEKCHIYDIIVLNILTLTNSKGISGLAIVNQEDCRSSSRTEIEMQKLEEVEVEILYHIGPPNYVTQLLNVE
jgi:hypothetical protein